MDDWNEIKTAAVVARSGALSAAAEALGVHRATVNRHVEHLEAALGAKLFQRHSRGVTPTELGLKLLRIADAADAQFGELQREARGLSGDLAGEFVVTSVDVLSPLVLPVIERFRRRHPKVSIRYVSSDRVLKLAYGEADVAFRIGPEPSDPDNVVRPFRRVQMALYASAAYAARYGVPQSEADFGAHSFVGPDQDAPSAPFIDWMRKTVPGDRIVFKSNSIAMLWRAAASGAAIGFLPTAMAKTRSDLIEVLAPRPEWEDETWTVTHADLHRSAKVQAFLSALKSQLAEEKTDN